MKDWPDNCVDLVLTDPPYKVSQKYGGGVDADNLMGVSSILRTFPEISRVLKDDRFFVTFYDNRILPFLFEATKKTNLIYRSQLFLYKRWGVSHLWIGWMRKTDPICIFVNGYNKPFMPKAKGQIKHDCYIRNGPDDFTSGHPAQKPLEIIQDIISWCSNPNEIVFDPYIGAGTTAYAAKMLGRRYIGIEISEKYCEIARQRLEAVDTGVPVKDQRQGQMPLFSKERNAKE
jgi:DNA modification methylase